MLKIDYFDPEFSTEQIQEHDPFNTIVLDPDTGVLVLREIDTVEKGPDLKNTGKKPVEKHTRSKNDDTTQIRLF
jgi:hypothetical protein